MRAVRRHAEEAHEPRRYVAQDRGFDGRRGDGLGIAGQVDADMAVALECGDQMLEPGFGIGGGIEQGDAVGDGLTRHDER